MSQPPPGWPQDPPPSRPGPQFAASPKPSAWAAGAGFFAAGHQTFVKGNPTTFTAILVVALYLVLAATTGIVMIGIFPAVLAFRALQRREPLAVLAIGAAAVAIAFSITVLSRH